LRRRNKILEDRFMASMRRFLTIALPVVSGQVDPARASSTISQLGGVAVSLRPH
jgi:hypothetical protein